ncbi:GNAT family N-acetyltransferase [Mucilaginibacter rubeus]|uniref:GNAT family N-acetyltransferase n=2 Tax=Mucilaginibacter rubeus TaxID=2027860 RepID=A0A364WYV1_9SPHI|nr:MULTISPECIES: arsenic resistance N-acetyltransferase ArsN2 [Mucilaginibacter]QEM06104.1 GNAT family N-acetyltransferase [Mucilaginibacter rubeus]QEM13621.1 GNAT family N-acetyltransferase [Mucilaginibacter rubeus]QEM18684.1 GNAT family N-acetyltransferase [Mucilaginibacter gossypii]QTE36321.1 arsenic resistance N-acetyltransferase ArsN2 [Mucilaginibacter gossypii]QTE44774.1 GNAT family N-acetyltransferase [Mucilaginibacter rubeus]
MIIDKAQPYKEKMIELLAAEKLPVADLPEKLDNFIVAIQDGIVVGVAGVEVYGNNGLLRSLAVHPEHRGAGIAGKLLARLNSISKKNSLTALYLLTETAPAYFERKKYSKITREEVPVEVQQSSEFSHVCPVSAIVMKKEL